MDNLELLENSKIIMNFNKICRICLTEKENNDLNSLFTNNYNEMLQELTSIEVRFTISKKM